jgi:hypothetical protein
MKEREREAELIKPDPKKIEQPGAPPNRPAVLHGQAWAKEEFKAARWLKSEQSGVKAQLPRPVN